MKSGEETDFNSVIRHICRSVPRSGGRARVEEDWGELWIAEQRGVRRLGTQSLETAREIPRKLLPFITHHTTSLVLGCAGHTIPTFSPGFFMRILCVVLGGNLLGFFFFHLSLSLDY